ncbi:MAG: MurR/RpiR family transcriptional regulator [Erysipelotrichaceae bacterium]|nr:MurR/RpiR family transcriptional regulator [Erysipelotrichaceae bacterium]
MFKPQEVQSLNDLELEVYNYVISNYEKVMYMRIRELADAVHVSTTTILHFCKKVGYEGFTEFKLHLKQYISDSIGSPVPDDATGESLDFLKKSMSEEFEKQLDEFAEIILRTEKVMFLGSGNSGMIAKYGARYLSSLGKFCLCIDDPHYPSMNSYFNSGVVIVLSVSGESKDIIRHIKRFKEKNCTILSITNSSKCTVAKLSDKNISYYINQIRIKDEYDITSQIPTISIIERIGKRVYSDLIKNNMLF